MSDILSTGVLNSKTEDRFVRLNTEAVRSILAEQQLKRWWVAEFTGVHKTTLRRWLSGGIEKVRQSRVVALARLLQVQVEHIQLDPQV